MGCDIHLFVEVKKTANSSWELAPGQLDDCYECKGSGIDPDTDVCGNCQMPKKDHLKKKKKHMCMFSPKTEYTADTQSCRYCLEGQSVHGGYYGGRDYELFGILSGVRDEPDPQWTQEDRGFPSDVCANLRSLAEDVDLHSHGYYYLEELEARPGGWENFPEFLKMLEKLKGLSAHHQNVRIVFCYDN